jgi:hypothetical protein
VAAATGLRPAGLIAAAPSGATRPELLSAGASVRFPRTVDETTRAQAEADALSAARQDETIAFPGAASPLGIGPSGGTLEARTGNCCLPIR